MKPKTPLGNALRSYRLGHGETQGELAEILKVSSAYLSAIESGDKSATNKLVKNIAAHYQLNKTETDELCQVSLRSQPTIKIDINQESEKTKTLVAMFARNFSSLENSKQDEIIKILGEAK